MGQLLEYEKQQENLKLVSSSPSIGVKLEKFKSSLFGKINPAKMALNLSDNSQPQSQQAQAPQAAADRGSMALPIASSSSSSSSSSSFINKISKKLFATYPQSQQSAEDKPVNNNPNRKKPFIFHFDHSSSSNDLISNAAANNNLTSGHLLLSPSQALSNFNLNSPTTATAMDQSQPHLPFALPFAAAAMNKSKTIESFVKELKLPLHSTPGQPMMRRPTNLSMLSSSTVVDEASSIPLPNKVDIQLFNSLYSCTI